MNMFEASAWPAGFVEFFYGDCAPNLGRPQKVGVRVLFHYLANHAMRATPGKLLQSIHVQFHVQNPECVVHTLALLQSMLLQLLIAVATSSNATATEHGSRRIPAVSLDCQLLACRRLLSCKMQIYIFARTYLFIPQTTLPLEGFLLPF